MNEVQRANRDILAALVYEFNVHPGTISDLTDLNRNYNLGIKNVLINSSISPWESWLLVSRSFDGTAATIKEQYYANAYGVLLNDLNASTLEIHADKLEVWCDAPRINNFPLPVGWSWRIIGLGSEDAATEGVGIASSAPASDRRVSITHNQYTELEPSISDLVGCLKRDNGLPEDPTFRQRIIGQISAGRELLRSGEIKVYILQVTLLAALTELIERYKDTVIGGLAVALLDHLLSPSLGLK